jgi:hypothetical protein
MCRAEQSAPVLRGIHRRLRDALSITSTSYSGILLICNLERTIRLFLYFKAAPEFDSVPLVSARELKGGIGSASRVEVA